MLSKLLHVILKLLRPSAGKPETQQQPTPVSPSPNKESGRGLNNAGLRLIKEFEGCKLEAYQDIVGIWTIGYGHTRTARAGMKITKEQAEELLLEDLKSCEATIYREVKVRLTRNQFSALVSFIFNLGSGAFQKSTLLKKLNTTDYSGAATEFLRWNKAGGQEVPGLTRRRQAERELFLLTDNENNSSV